MKPASISEAFKGFTHRDCEHYPCHTGVRRPFNCLFCYCPLYEHECPGPYRLFTNARGQARKDCSACRLPHQGYGPSWRFIQCWLAAPLWSGGRQSRARIHAIVRKLRDQYADTNCHLA
jgi:hypothetical protein